MKKTRKYVTLDYEKRKQIERGLKKGIDVRDIAEIIGVHYSTIYRELTICGMTKESYNAKEAQKKIIERNYGEERWNSDE
jgi:IS30 family transposase